MDPVFIAIVMLRVALQIQFIISFLPWKFVAISSDVVLSLVNHVALTQHVWHEKLRILCRIWNGPCALEDKLSPWLSPMVVYLVEKTWRSYSPYFFLNSKAILYFTLARKGWWTPSNIWFSILSTAVPRVGLLIYSKGII